jgi:TATA-box binding protein (TBP) (component of TFIID and TFIIIB)
MSAIDLEWQNFLNDPSLLSDGMEIFDEIKPTEIVNSEMPKCGDIYISTKTKISYLNTEIPLAPVFWEIPIIPYTSPMEGVVKKQMKFNCFSEQELEELLEKTKDLKCLDNYVISKVEGNQGRAKYRDIRKISIGLCKKDVTSHRTREKSAFYNCFVLILRVLVDNIFREVHVKVFNTGKLEIPGIQSDSMLDNVLKVILRTLQPLVPVEVNNTLTCSRACQTVLINSNFNCGFYINREKLFDILKGVYKLQCSYDACSYPGVQSKYYYYDGDKNLNGRQDLKEDGESHKISFMIFRTGSVLIVGKCSEDIIMEVYEFIKGIFRDHYLDILDPLGLIENGENEANKNGDKRKKLRRFAKVLVEHNPNLITLTS